MKNRPKSKNSRKIGKDLDTEDTICPVCKNKVEFYWEPSFNGIRGRCAKCNTNWPAS